MGDTSRRPRRCQWVDSGLTVDKASDNVRCRSCMRYTDTVAPTSLWRGSVAVPIEIFKCGPRASITLPVRSSCSGLGNRAGTHRNKIQRHNNSRRAPRARQRRSSEMSRSGRWLAGMAAFTSKNWLITTRCRLRQLKPCLFRENVFYGHSVRTVLVLDSVRRYYRASTSL